MNFVFTIFVLFGGRVIFSFFLGWGGGYNSTAGGGGGGGGG